MMRISSVLFFLVLLSSCSSLTDSKKSIVYQPTGVVLLGSGVSTVVLSPKSQLVVQVPSNPSTGFRWVLNLPPKATNCFSLLKDGLFVKDTQTSHPIPQIGAPGLQEWEIQVNCSGIFVLQWNNLRPWEKEHLPINTYQLRIEVTP